MLISASGLHSRIQKGDVTVFDCRFTLTDPDAGHAQYKAGHIPGAIYMDLDSDLSGPHKRGSGEHPLPDTQVFAEKLGRAGVGNNRTVVVYDDGEGMATRAWWLIRYFGHDDVHVLNGGLSAWLAAGYELDTSDPEPEHATFTPHVRSNWIVDISDVEQVISGKRQATLLDARAAERYRGEVEPLHPRAGHIPTAKNAPWQEGLDSAKAWCGTAEQAERFRPLLEQDSETISYCGSGVTACANIFALELAGIRNVKLYPGSWREWSSDPNRDIATDPE